MSFPYVLPFHVILQFSNSLRHSSSSRPTKKVAGGISFIYRVFFVSLLYLPHEFFRQGLLLVFLLLKLFRHSSYFIKVKLIGEDSELF